MKTAIYPGSFDPITNGHIDILKRSLKAFDKVIVLIGVNPDKKYNFTVEERLEMIRQALKDEGIENVTVDSYSGLTVEYAKKHNAPFLIRGLRAVSDFEYEFALASANEFIDKDIDMIFFMAGNSTSFISSSSIMEMYKNGVDVSKLVPQSVSKHLK